MTGSATVRNDSLFSVCSRSQVLSSEDTLNNVAGCGEVEWGGFVLEPSLLQKL